MKSKKVESLTKCFFKLIWEKIYKLFSDEISRDFKVLRMNFGISEAKFLPPSAIFLRLTFMVKLRNKNQ